MSVIIRSNHNLLQMVSNIVEVYSREADKKLTYTLTAAI